MRISRKQQTAAVLSLCGLLLFSGCVSTPQPRLSADAQAEALSQFSLGLLAGAEGDSAAAFGHMESAIRLDPEATLLYAPAAALALQSGKTNEALRLAHELIRRRPDEPDSQLLLGTLYIEKARSAKTPEEARETVLQGIGFLRKSVTLAPDELHRRQQLAIALLVVQQPEEAEAVLLEADGSSAGEIPLRIALGSFHLQAGRYSRAYEFFESVQRELPEEQWLDDPAFLLQLLIAAQKSGDSEEAVTVLLFTYETRPDLFHQYLAALLIPSSPVSVGDTVELLNAFRARNPGAVEALYYLMELQTERNEYEAAITAARQFEAAVQGTGDAELLNGLFYYQYASLHERAGDLDTAEELFYKAIETGHEAVRAAAQNYIAYMWAERGEKLETGLELIQQALAVEPENGAYLDTLGWIYYMQGRYTEALEKLKEALRFVEDDPVIREHLGDTYMKLGDRESAVLYWKRALELDPGSFGLTGKIEEASSQNNSH